MNYSGSAGRVYVASLDHNKIKRQYVDDLVSIKSLSRQYQISELTVKRILQGLGVTIRSHKKASKIQGERQRTGKQLECSRCGQAFYRHKAYAGRFKNVFCSQQCHIEQVKSRVSGRCESCGQDFEVPGFWKKRNAVRFCSTKCYHGWQVKEARVELNCASCGKYITKNRGRYNQVKGDNYFCSQRCSQDYRSRENHHNWKDGRTPLAELLRGHGKNRRWVKSVFERDSYTCQKCGAYGGWI